MLSGRSDAETAVFFVHGFTGDAVATWIDFHGLIDQMSDIASWWATCDLYFYQYRTLSDNVAVLASRFSQFLKEYFPTPPEMKLGRPSQECAQLVGQGSMSAFPVTSQYRSLILVGHSLGGVIIRQSLVDEAIAECAKSPGESDTTRQGITAANGCLLAAVRLFAPASFGFEPARFPGYCYHLMMEMPRLGRFLRPVVHANPLCEDLQSGSHRLSQLRQRTESLAMQHPWMHALRAHLLFGSREQMVYMDRYDCDPVYRIVENQDHRSVCKPTVYYSEPLGFVSYGIPRSASV